MSADLVLVRHGETVGNSSVRLYGSTDIELSEMGRAQMARVGDVINTTDYSVVYTSPLKRSREAAEIIAGGRGPAPVVVEGFREIDFGDWEGWSLEEAAQRDPENYEKWKTTGVKFRFPGGDSKEGFFARAAEAAREVFAEDRGPVLAVLHKGIIKAIVMELIGLEKQEAADMPIELGSIHRLKRNSSGWELLSANETEHLGDLRIPSS